MKKKKGVTLVYVVILSAFIIITSFGLLSMTVVNYRGRIAESDRIRNVYGSESGIDIAYNVTGKTMEGGVKYGFWQVSRVRCGGGDSSDPYAKCYKALTEDIEKLEEKIETLKEARALEQAKPVPDLEKIKDYTKQIRACNKGISVDNTTKEKVLKEEFRKAYKDYISIEKEEGITGNTNVLKDSILNRMYFDVSLSAEDKEVDGTTVKKVEAEFTPYSINFDGNAEIEVPKLKLNECEKKDEDIIETSSSSDEDHVYTVKFYKTHDEYFDLTVKSKFNSSDSSILVTDSPRIISAAYKIIVPNYDDVLWLNAESGKFDYTFENSIRGITVGGNMNVNTDLDVSGDVFVQGASSNDDDVYGKYEGGININSGKVNFNPSSGNHEVNIAVRKTFNIRDNTGVVVDGNIYAGNIYAGDVDDSMNGLMINKGNLTCGSIITNNDMTVNATNSDIIMDNFYGINDKSIEFDEDDENSNKDIKKTSSSIIINGYADDTGNGKSMVKVNNEAYILGTAHINTAKSYKTGESIAVKGNYTAYAVPVNPDEVFKYDAPLQLLDSDDVNEKAEHFENYWKGNGSGGIKLDNNEADYGGIVLPNPNNVHTIGAIVYKVNNDDTTTYVKSNTTTYDSSEELSGGTIYGKKAEYAKNVYDLGIEEHNDEHDYYVKCESGESHPELVEELLYALDSADLSGYDLASELSKEASDSEPALIINNDPTKTIVVNHNMKGFIVTNGKVVIKNGASFRGNIICGGDLNVTSGHCSIIYDKEVVLKAFELEPELIYNIFGHLLDVKTAGKDVEDSTTLKQALEGKYDIKKYLKMRIWKLIQ